MMREVLTRRFARLVKEDPDRTRGAWPDLVLIDGGAGQVSAAAGVLAELGIEAAAVRRRQGRRPRRRPRGVPRARPPAVRAAEPQPGALLRPAPARRGAPLRHRRAPAEAREGGRRHAARRDPRHRAGAQAQAARAFRQRQGGQPCRAGRPEGGRRHIRQHGGDDPCVLSRRAVRTSPATPRRTGEGGASGAGKALPSPLRRGDGGEAPHRPLFGAARDLDHPEYPDLLPRAGRALRRAGLRALRPAARRVGGLRPVRRGGADRLSSMAGWRGGGARSPRSARCWTRSPTRRWW